MAIKPFTCDLDPDTGIKLQLFLFKDVKNVEDIRNNIIKGIWKCAIIKPSLILDPFQVVVAANKAAVASKLDCLVTRTIYSEILFNLSLSKNISQSLSKFGIEKGSDMLVCFLTDTDNHNSEILAQIQGEMIPFTDLSKFTNLSELKNVYKINKTNIAEGCELLDIIVSRIVTKNFISH